MNLNYLLFAGIVALHLLDIENENPYSILFGGFVAGVCFTAGIVKTIKSRR